MSKRFTVSYYRRASVGTGKETDPLRTSARKMNVWWMPLHDVHRGMTYFVKLLGSSCSQKPRLQLLDAGVMSAMLCMLYWAKTMF